MADLDMGTASGATESATEVTRDGATVPAPDIERVAATPAAEELIARLETLHGPLMFHQSGGCCDGSSPMCYARGDFRVGSRDVYLGLVAGTPFYMSGPQFEYWRHTHLTIDVVKGRGSGFSVEAPEGVRFLIRSRLFTDDEDDQARTGVVLRGQQH